MRWGVLAAIAPLAATIAPRADATDSRGVALRSEPAPVGTRDYLLIHASGVVSQFWSDRDELRAEFARNGYAQPDNVTLAAGFALGVAFYGPRAELGFGFAGEKLASSYRGEADFRPVFGWLDFGHDLWRDSHTAFFASAGLGVDEVHLRFNAESAPVLADQMGTILGRIEIWRTTWQLHAGVGVEHLFLFTQDDAGARTGGWGLLAGTRLGYRAPFADGHWGGQDYDFSGGPRLGAQGAFAIVTVGLASGSWSPGSCEERCRMRPVPGTELTCHLNRCMLICDGPFGDCDGDLSNGCETVLKTTANCGGCGQGCTIDNGFPTCTQGVCRVAGCRPGFMDCDALSHNGCESQIRQDAENCGGCGRSCRAGQRCLAGACR